ncbi:uncharacterized protein LOC131336106 isoform X2 [Rhododendron vialii]|uniref:uncharacterized protein LOC131336106 isoform X1 n=1 Tax=Rhododendron vialii TaxID=182163 RepID=UPI00265F12D1|nr:uncharacterized protein LOC131336106 isoform X1 [Rhododendron vialii]XP_058227770.1 uncharacterized protein LOC131336106 isoform X2 [Rhododendron vialii]
MEDDHESGFSAPLSIVSLTPFSPSPRRLSTHFTKPNRPVRAARQLAWVSLQGRLVGAEEASSATTIGGGLSPGEAVAWELFSPMHRILVVAVVAVAAANSKKNRQIFQLMKSVELRDQVLLSMQQKLDNLCEQVNYFKDQPGTWEDMSFSNNVDFLFNEPIASEKVKTVACGHRLSDQHQANDQMDNSVVRRSSGDDLYKYKSRLSNVVQPDERRMSDLSDWGSSVTSCVDGKLNTLVIGQDIYNLKKECEEKDATIKELSTYLHSSEAAGSKRIAELEDIVRTKNMRITRLKKDMLVLEQKLVHLTRLRRPSFTSSNIRLLPVMAENLLYDMDSTTGSSSSDSEYPPRNRPQASLVKNQDTSASSSDVASRRKENSEQKSGCGSLMKQTDRWQKSRPVSPLKEKSMNEDLGPISKPMKLLSAGGDLKTRRRAQTGSNAAASQKRWV